MTRRSSSFLLVLILAFLASFEAAGLAAEKPVAITASELATRLRQDPSIVMADVRSLKSFRRRHLKGAQSLPFSEISRWAPKLKATEWVVLYCACPHDEVSSEAAIALMSRYGHARSMVLKQGIDGWIAHGYPFEAEKP